MSQSVQHASQQLIGHADFQRFTQADDFAAGADAHQIAQRHNQHLVVSETYDFGEHGFGGALILNMTRFTDSHVRSERLDHDADYLANLAVLPDEIRGRQRADIPVCRKNRKTCGHRGQLACAGGLMIAGSFDGATETGSSTAKSRRTSRSCVETLLSIVPASV